jgi:hypothetical protein
MRSDPSILTPDAAAEYEARMSGAALRLRAGGFLFAGVCAAIVLAIPALLLSLVHPILGAAFFFVSFMLFVVNRLDRRLREIRDRLPPRPD